MGLQFGIGDEDVLDFTCVRHVDGRKISPSGELRRYKPPALVSVCVCVLGGGGEKRFLLFEVSCGGGGAEFHFKDFTAKWCTYGQRGGESVGEREVNNPMAPPGLSDVD